MESGAYDLTGVEGKRSRKQVKIKALMLRIKKQSFIHSKIKNY